jgi:hypothetical protein
MMANTDAGSARRSFLSRILAAVSAVFLGTRVSAQDDAPAAPEGWRFDGLPLTTRVRKGEPPVQPLDTMLLFERGDDNNDRAMTHEVLSLIHEEKGLNSFPWTIYASLATHHEVGDACVLCSRLHKHGPGWSTGLHSEVFNHGRAVALGANIEMSTDYEGPETTQIIGLNIQAVAASRPMQYGIQVHDGQGSFEKGIGLKGKGQAGLDIEGTYERGVDLHDNDIWLNEGACVVLDGAGQVRVRYVEGRIEFLNGDKCFGHLDVNGDDHAL